MPFSIYGVFSWRGIYDQVCFSVDLSNSTKEKNLDMVKRALTWNFDGYKGGEYEYWLSTLIHFDSDSDIADDTYLWTFIDDHKDNEFIKHLVKWYEDNRYSGLTIYEDILGHDIRWLSKVAYYDQEMQKLTIGWIMNLDKDNFTIGISDDKFSTEIRNNVSLDRVVQLERVDNADDILSL